MDVPRMTARRLYLAPILLVTLLACASGGPPVSGPVASGEPLMSLERFMDAVDQRDLVAMGYLFGTAEGPVAETGGGLGCGFKRFGSWIGLGSPCRTWPEVELQLDLIATILEHEGFEVVDSRPVAGRQSRTQGFTVDIVRRGDTIRAVPFEVVQRGSGVWLVERIDLERVTGG